MAGWVQFRAGAGLPYVASGFGVSIRNDGALRRHARGLPYRHARDLLIWRPESLLFVAYSPVQLKTLDSVSEENIVAALLVFQPHGMTAPRIVARRFSGAARREAPSFPQSVKRESRVFCFCRFRAGTIKACPRPRAGDSGFRIGGKHSRYASLFSNRTE